MAAKATQNLRLRVKDPVLNACIIAMSRRAPQLPRLPKPALPQLQVIRIIQTVHPRYRMCAGTKSPIRLWGSLCQRMSVPALCMNRGLPRMTPAAGLDSNKLRSKRRGNRKQECFRKQIVR